MLRVGQGSSDITPSAGTELAGFHRLPGNERRSVGVRQQAAVRALVLDDERSRVALVVAELCTFPRPYADRVRTAIAKATGLNREHVRVCATHTHSMPTMRGFRQWGGVPSESYRRRVEDAMIRAVDEAVAELAPAELSVGRARVVGGNFNRTVPDWRTDAEFSPQATEDDRWLDTTLHALVFERSGFERPLIWYHFCAHPVCYTDENVGPDWPGLVAARFHELEGVDVGYLQGHSGDVNPGNGEPWLGDPEATADAVLRGLEDALVSATRITVDEIGIATADVDIPLDIELQDVWLNEYQSDPAACASGVWVDAPFAEDWYAEMARWDRSRDTYAAPISAVRLGPVVLGFHPAELFSFYGLKLRHSELFDHTLLVGYTDDFVGYLTDPNAYENGEYAAIVVPKLMGLPPFKRAAASHVTCAIQHLLAGFATSASD